MQTTAVKAAGAPEIWVSTAGEQRVRSVQIFPRAGAVAVPQAGRGEDVDWQQLRVHSGQRQRDRAAVAGRQLFTVAASLIGQA